MCGISLKTSTRVKSSDLAAHAWHDSRIDEDSARFGINESHVAQSITTMPMVEFVVHVAKHYQGNTAALLVRLVQGFSQIRVAMVCTPAAAFHARAHPFKPEGLPLSKAL